MYPFEPKFKFDELHSTIKYWQKLNKAQPELDFESSCLFNNSEFKQGIGSRMVDFKPINDDESNEIVINICFDSNKNII